MNELMIARALVLKLSLLYNSGSLILFLNSYKQKINNAVLIIIQFINLSVSTLSWLCYFLSDYEIMTWHVLFSYFDLYFEPKNTFFTTLLTFLYWPLLYVVSFATDCFVSMNYLFLFNVLLTLTTAQ